MSLDQKKPAPRKVRHLYAWVLVHSDGSETLPNLTVKNAIVPLMCSTEEGANKFKTWAQGIADDTNCKLKLMRSNGLTELDSVDKNLVELVETNDVEGVASAVAKRLSVR